jgi:3-deoxy-D-manno-octulosonate cytidylyltransferase
MKNAALIPARYDASRFPGKLMGNLGGKTVIFRTYESAINMNLFDEVYVVTDSDIIFNEISSHNGKVIKSLEQHSTGTDRIAEAAKFIDADIFLNIQGDEPFVSREPLAKLLKVFDDRDVKVASLIQKLTDKDLINDPNYVKVVVDNNNFALYFSRSPIPFIRDNYNLPHFFEHIGVYAFRKEYLELFPKLKPTELEKCEKIEALRYLENGIKMKMVETDYMGIEIDMPEDLVKANEYLKLNCMLTPPDTHR